MLDTSGNAVLLKGLGFGGANGGSTGPTGWTGMRGPTGVTGTSGDKYLTATTTTVTFSPTVGGVQSFFVGVNLAYIPGNVVVVQHSSDSGTHFDGRVQIYTASTGQIVIDSIANIYGSFTLAIYTVNLNGIAGPTGYT
jgi:hypothetical protein